MQNLSCPEEWMETRWHVLFVRSNQEKKTAQRLAERGIEHFLPCYSSRHQWKDRRVTVHTPLFPGYVFVKIPFVERIRVLTLPNILSLLGTKYAPAIISEDDIAWIKRGIGYGSAEPHPYLKTNELVVITSGVLAGMRGILLRQHQNARVVISIDSIARSFSVEVGLSQIEPVKIEYRLQDALLHTSAV